MTLAARQAPSSGVLLRLPCILTCRTVDTTFFAVILEPTGHGLLKSDETLRLTFTTNFPFRIMMQPELVVASTRKIYIFDRKTIEHSNAVGRYHELLGLRMILHKRNLGEASASGIASRFNPRLCNALTVSLNRSWSRASEKKYPGLRDMIKFCS